MMLLFYPDYFIHSNKASFIKSSHSLSLKNSMQAAVKD